MKEEKLKESFVLKAVSYIMLPIFVLLIIFNAIILWYCAQYPEARTNEKDYYVTDIFAQNYENNIYSIISQIDSITNDQNYLNIYPTTYEESVEKEQYNTNDENYLILTPENNEEKISNEEKIYYSSKYQQSGIKYLIINNDTNECYTNLNRTSKTDTVIEIKKIILQGENYWNLKNKQIDSNIGGITGDNTINNKIYQNIANKNYDIYTSYSEGDIEESIRNDICANKYLYEISGKYYKLANIVIAVSIIGVFVTLVYLITSAGHREGKEEIYLTWVDKLPLEILGIFIFMAMTIGIAVIYGTVALTQYVFNTGITLTILSIYITGIILMHLFLSIVKRIKAKQFIKNSICWRVCRFIKRILLSIINSIRENTKASTRITIYCVAFLLISFILIVLRGAAIIFLIGFWIYVYICIIRKVNETIKLQKALKSIYEGNVNIELKENELHGILKEMAKYVNDIAGGFSNAVEQSIKSERMKTELITNVSHDIKTPLTSIINYVDLLKTEDLHDEKAREYLEILDNKSQRLKKLIEDLVEASKASSGNLKLEKQLINVNELIKQLSGEFEDKFKAKGLEVITDYLEEEAYILADNRYIYRIIENLYSNISKYALENSRVYIDIKKIDDKITIAIKNISKERLNISADELMQRFVRGDSSRNTEGSGLGLSIASSLTELQGGKFNIYLDGDLFKVVIEFESRKKN